MFASKIHHTLSFLPIVTKGVVVATLLWLAWRAYEIFFTPLKRKKVAEQYPTFRELKWGQRGHKIPAYPNGWYGLVASEEVVVGLPKVLTCCGLDLTVLREADGKLRCFSTAKSEAAGEVQAISYPIAEANLMIYFYFHASGEEPTWQVPVLPEIDGNKFQLHGVCEHWIACHIQDIWENTADVSHLDCVHGDFLIPAPSWISKYFRHHLHEAEWEPINDHLADIKVLQTLTFCGFKVPLCHAVIAFNQAGPGLVMLHISTCVGKAIIMESMCPQQPLLQKTTRRVYGDSTMPRCVAKFLLWMVAKQFERDMPIWNNKIYLNKPILVKTDTLIPKFRRWFLKFYSDLPQTLH